MVPLLVLSIILAFLTVDYLAERFALRRALVATEALEAKAREALRASFQGSPLEEVPAGIFVAPGHVWARLDHGGSVRVGVDRLVLSLLGGLDSVHALPEGSKLKREGPLVMLRRGSRALAIRSPLEGKVSAVNRAAIEAPDQVPVDPFDRGWIYEVTPTGPSDGLKKMVVGERARQWMCEEVHRLRELLQVAAGSGPSAEPILADGGALSEPFAEQIGDQAWEELVAGFFGTDECVGGDSDDLNGGAHSRNVT